MNAIHPTAAQFEGLERELRFGPGMRAQRLTEAGFLIAAIFAQDLRFAYVAFVFTLLQALSPRWVPVARGVARLVRFNGEHRIGNLYFDLGGVRGACAISVLVQAAAIAFVWAGHATAGYLILALPAASLLMAPTLGFCAGCWFYVLGRDVLVRRGWLRRGHDESGDIPIARDDGADDQPQLRA
ncbi:DUF4395 family protein [Piscinibacter sp.]|jgi:hypothetical protein|uniref:DUF4395 family protein n=1 Tax=Piscinibacter sp. TaxID=1903157 RepID=UPI0035599701